MANAFRNRLAPHLVLTDRVGRFSPLSDPRLMLCPCLI